MTIDHVLNAEASYIYFFRKVWIPDECFFNSLVRKSPSKIDKPLTHYAFNEDGSACVYEHVVKDKKKYFLRKYLIS